jgi:membrane protein implicated in regulation of membrane protease activity
MKFGLMELAGAFLLVIGIGSAVAAASMVSTALAVLGVGVVLIFAAVMLIYVAATMERASKADQRPGDRL